MDDEEYSRVIHEFYQTYRPLQKRYNLRLHSHFDVYGNDYIEIWEYKGDVRGSRICMVKKEGEAACYRRAIEELKNYGATERIGKMRKEQDKKPNFKKDLNAGILDELTKGGKIKNAVGLAGEVKELAAVTNICGLPFSGYLGKIETPRPSGDMDEVVIAFEENTPFKQNGVEFDVLREFAAGSRLLVAGKMQTLKDFESGRVLVYVLAEFVALSPKAMQQDDVALVGELAYNPVHRVTPRGKHITDMFVKVQNVLTAGTCYIPCICWQETADEVAGWQQGDKVKLLGRYQSREYSKLKDIDNEESRETRTAYELSVNYIERVGEVKDAE